MTEPVRRRLDLLFFLALVAAFLGWTFLPGWKVDADSYYHLGLAQLYAENGWVRSFPWLDLTILGDTPFVDAHLLMHLALVPLAAWLPPVTAVQAGAFLSATALWLSVYLVLRRNGVRWAGFFTLLGGLSSPIVLTVSGFLKGAGLFLVILVWFLDALLAGAARRVLVLAWLSVYAYVGAPLLPAFAFLFLVTGRVFQGRWSFRPFLYACAGMLAGLLLNPFWPGQWTYLYRELGNAITRPDYLVPGVFFGSEWMTLTGRDFLRFAWAPLSAWLALLVAHLRRASAVPAPVAGGVVVTLAMLLAALLQAKFIFHFLVVSAVFLPLALPHVLPEDRRWRGVLAGLAVLAAAGILAVSWHRERGPSEEPPAAFEAMGQWLQSRTAEGERVVAPWGDFPGLFLFDRHNRYVVGLNVNFLRWKDEAAFKAFYFLYNGQITDPELLLPMYFGDARYVLVRTRPRNNGERELAESLARNPRFVEEPSPVGTWRLFHLAPESGK